MSMYDEKNVIIDCLIKDSDADTYSRPSIKPINIEKHFTNFSEEATFSLPGVGNYDSTSRPLLQSSIGETTDLVIRSVLEFINSDENGKVF